MQLTLDFSSRPQSRQPPSIKASTWLDVSAIAKGVGFNAKVEVSHSLNDALAPLQFEDEQDYDQRLYDALWLGHHYLSLDQRQSVTFTFDFLHDDKYAGEYTQASLRLRVETQQQAVLLGLLQDF